MSKTPEEMARMYANKIAIPEIRSMYPSMSRGEMAHHLTLAFLAGREAGLEEAAGQCELIIEDNNGSGWTEWAQGGEQALRAIRALIGKKE